MHTSVRTDRACLCCPAWPSAACVQVVSSLAPLLLGTLYRRGAPLRLLLSVSVPAAYALTALCFWRAMAAREAEAAA